jgi:hypothetical protein
MSAAGPAEIGTLRASRMPSPESPTLSINSAIAAADSVSELHVIDLPIENQRALLTFANLPAEFILACSPTYPQL